jgi:hypothetical protein
LPLRRRAGCRGRARPRRWTSPWRGNRSRCRRWRLSAVSPASVERAAGSDSAPDDHFTAAPNCRVTVSGGRRVEWSAGRCPTVSTGIVSPAGTGRWRSWNRSGSWSRSLAGWCPVSPGDAVDAVGTSTPNDHFTARPDCRVNVSRIGRIGGAGGRPAVRNGIVSPAAVHIAAAIIPTPG